MYLWARQELSSGAKVPVRTPVSKDRQEANETKSAFINFIQWLTDARLGGADERTDLRDSGKRLTAVKGTNALFVILRYAKSENRLETNGTTVHTRHQPRPLFPPRALLEISLV